MIEAAPIVAYLAVGAITAAVAGRRGGSYDSPAWALFCCLFLWPIAAALYGVGYLCDALDAAAIRLGFKQAEGSSYW